MTKKTYSNGASIRKPQLKNRAKADLDNDKKISPYELKRGLAIEAAMAVRKGRTKRTSLTYL